MGQNWLMTLKLCSSNYFFVCLFSNADKWKSLQVYNDKLKEYLKFQGDGIHIIWDKRDFACLRGQYDPWHIAKVNAGRGLANNNKNEQTATTKTEAKRTGRSGPKQRKFLAAITLM